MLNVAKIPGIQTPFKVANKIGQDTLVPKELGTRILLPTVKGGSEALKQSFAGNIKNPTTLGNLLYQSLTNGERFSVESTKPLEAALKRLDNKLSYLRSLG